MAECGRWRQQIASSAVQVHLVSLLEGNIEAPSSKTAARDRDIGWLAALLAPGCLLLPGSVAGAQSSKLSETKSR